MAIKNSVRNVLPGMGTSGLRGGSVEGGTSPVTIQVPQGMSMGKFRVQSTTVLTSVAIVGSDGVNPTVLLYGATLVAGGAAQTSIMGDFMCDLNLTSVTCDASGTIDFEVWGQPGAVT